MPKKRPRSGKPYVIGVSGRTGSGKSTVVRVLEEKGAAVLEAALLFEASWDDLADEVWVTMAPLAVCAERAAEHLGISREEAMARIERQLPDESRMARADVIIDTSGSLLQTQEAADGEWERLQERLGADSAAKA